MAGLQRRHGDLVHWRIGPQDVVMVARSDLARDVLVTHHRSFKKGPGFERAQIVLGEGLLTSEGDVHLRHRRMIQPAFHRRSVAAYGDVMVSEAARLRDGWNDGATVDVAERDDARHALDRVSRAVRPLRRGRGRDDRRGHVRSRRLLRLPRYRDPAALAAHAPPCRAALQARLCRARCRHAARDREPARGRGGRRTAICSRSCSPHAMSRATRPG